MSVSSNKTRSISNEHSAEVPTLALVRAAGFSVHSTMRLGFRSSLILSLSCKHLKSQSQPLAPLCVHCRYIIWRSFFKGALRRLLGLSFSLRTGPPHSPASPVYGVRSFKHGDSHAMQSTFVSWVLAEWDDNLSFGKWWNRECPETDVLSCCLTPLNCPESKFAAMMRRRHQGSAEATSFVPRPPGTYLPF